MKIEIVINTDGTVSGDVVEGPGGPICTKKLDELLGDMGEAGPVRKKREFYQQQTTQKTRKEIRR